jgi:Domain of unknown function (DUF1707)
MTTGPPNVNLLSANSTLEIRREQDMDNYRFDTDPSQRAGDAEREQTADRLRRSHTEGRLDVQELQDRIDRCYAAKTVGELRAIVADLPGDDDATRRFAGRRSLRSMRLFPVFPIVLTILLISALFHAHGHGHWFGLWLLLPLFFLTRFWLWRGRPWRMGRRSRDLERRV